MKTCECGVVGPDDADYCAKCGRRLPETVRAEPQPAQVEYIMTVSPNGGQQRRIKVVIASFTAVVLVVALALTYFTRHVHIKIGSSDLVSVQLSLNVCKTFPGAPSETPTKLPASEKVDLPKTNSTGLAIYSDNEGLIKVLAPSGWTCLAQIEADGSSWVHVYPSGQSDEFNRPIAAGLTSQEVTASQSSVCIGCREELACPLFAAAASAYHQNFQGTCPTDRPSTEVVTRVNDDLVEFTDPPGVHGDANPSGGAYPAMGTMTYFSNLVSDSSWTETCVLAPSSTTPCQSILGNFNARYGKR